MKYAFIDYENLNNLDGLNLAEYKRIFLFTGSTTKSINLSESFTDEINITLITVKAIAKNNVDFHIAYYLGKLDETIDKNIEFYILSNDRGYDGICNFIANQKNGRICLRKSVMKEGIEVDKAITETIISNPEIIDISVQALNEYIAHIIKNNTPSNKRHLPTKLSSLQNDIHSRTCLRELNKQHELSTITKVINGLILKKYLKITNSKVSYL